MVLIDTSAFIEFLNRTGSPVSQEIEGLITQNLEVAFPDIGIMEILQGIKNDKNCIEVQKSLLTFPIFSLKSIESYIAASNLYRKCKKKGLTIRNTADILIAQIALENNLVLLHNDRDFEVIARVSVLRLYKI